ncbi:hypothetical protein LguiB_020548 [Lonicera macranthoides]
METEDQTLVQDCNPENLDPSPVQDEYAPVIFSQETEDCENILRARASGKGVLTSPFKLLKSNQLGVVLTFAINNTNLPPDATPEQCINATIGYVQPPPWTAIAASVGVIVITLLLSHIFHAAINRIAKVEHDYREMMELKHRAEAADIAKSQMLMDTNLDANQLDYAETAYASGNALISLINEVLDQAKIEWDRFELEAVPFNVRAALDNVLSLFLGKSHEKGIEVHHSLPISLN